MGSTGRGLPTERHPFITLTKNKKGQFEGLYLDYAAISYYDGTRLLIGAILVRVLGGVSSSLGRLAYMLIPAWISIGLVLASWLFGPFIFNPHQFQYSQFCLDIKGWCTFFFHDNGEN